ncbi:MAG: 4-hydroxy-tetrahydrodipicolinate synthase [Gammaproteobacteria bacterium]|nr:4-hydroxy-tetrahydrodipicolinate synthase [Gammaproteobacteria bacterium]
MITGSLVALVTPMLDDGSVDYDTLEDLVEWHIAEGRQDAIVPVGTTGESATLTADEHCDVMKRVVDVVNKRVPVIAGTGSNSTQEAILFTQAAKDAGADACLLVTPYYNKPSQEGLFRHYEAIAKAVKLPQVLYNVPGRTACDMLPGTVARLAKLDEVIAIKEATADVDRTLETWNFAAHGLVVYSGDDATAVDLMLNGAKGTISVTANVVPAAMHAVCKPLLPGTPTEARKLNESLMGLHTGLFVEANPIPVKWALAEMGEIGPTIRLPLTTLAEEYHDAVRKALSQAGAGVMR